MSIHLKKPFPDYIEFNSTRFSTSKTTHIKNWLDAINLTLKRKTYKVERNRLCGKILSERNVRTLKSQLKL